MTMDLSLMYLPTWRAGFGISLTDYYEELTASVKLADRLGWARAITTEHHFHYYGGAVPNPAVLLAAWARETTQIRLGTGVSLMGLRHPLQVAEDYALVDQLSGGRCDMGIGKGFAPHEFAAFHVNGEELVERMAETLQICIKFWAGSPFAHQGKFFQFERLEPWPTTVNGRLPIWNAASKTRENFVNAGEQGYYLMMNQYNMSFDSLVERFGWYCEAWEKAGHKSDQRKAMVALMTHLADTEEQAIAEAKGAFQEHACTAGKVMQGRQWDTDYAADIAALNKMCASDGYDDVFPRTLICTPEQAAQRISRYLDLGFTEIGIVPRYAGLSAEQCMTSIQRVQEEVLPLL